MGMPMDCDGIPLSFITFLGNESEQPSLQRIKEMVAEKLSLNESVISSNAGLGSGDDRRYSMTEGRKYISVQSPRHCLYTTRIIGITACVFVCYGDKLSSPVRSFAHYKYKKRRLATSLLL